MSKLRLVKVVVQPTFVLEDDDGNLTEQVVDPVAVPAKDWPTYSTDGFAEASRAFEAQFNGAGD